MDQHNHEELQPMAEETVQEEYVPRPPFQRALAWIAIAVVLFGLGGTIYWMLTFTP